VCVHAHRAAKLARIVPSDCIVPIVGPYKTTQLTVESDAASHVLAKQAPVIEHFLAIARVETS
jgi:hypothetical protein